MTSHRWLCAALFSDSFLFFLHSLIFFASFLSRRWSLKSRKKCSERQRKKKEGKSIFSRLASIKDVTNKEPVKKEVLDSESWRKGRRSKESQGESRMRRDARAQKRSHLIIISLSFQVSQLDSFLLLSWLTIASHSLPSSSSSLLCSFFSFAHFFSALAESVNTASIEVLDGVKWCEKETEEEREKNRKKQKKRRKKDRHSHTLTTSALTLVTHSVSLLGGAEIAFFLFLPSTLLLLVVIGCGVSCACQTRHLFHSKRHEQVNRVTLNSLSFLYVFLS